mgnify:CR=1 FL=1
MLARQVLKKVLATPIYVRPTGRREWTYVGIGALTRLPNGDDRPLLHSSTLAVAAPEPRRGAQDVPDEPGGRCLDARRTGRRCPSRAATLTRLECKTPVVSARGPHDDIWSYPGPRVGARRDTLPGREQGGAMAIAAVRGAEGPSPGGVGDTCPRRPRDWSPTWSAPTSQANGPPGEVLSHLLFPPGWNAVTLLQVVLRARSAGRGDRADARCVPDPRAPHDDAGPVHRRARHAAAETCWPIWTRARRSRISRARRASRSFKTFMGTEEIPLPVFVGAMFEYHWNDHAAQLAKIRQAIGLPAVS